MSSNSEAYQKNNNLMMSPKSIINANPQLKIYNDDVKCTHSSTTGDLDDEMIYYMATPTIFHATKVSFLLCVMYNWWFY